MCSRRKVKQASLSYCIIQQSHRLHQHGTDTTNHKHHSNLKRGVSGTAKAPLPLPPRRPASLPVAGPGPGYSYYSAVQPSALARLLTRPGRAALRPTHTTGTQKLLIAMVTVKVSLPVTPGLHYGPALNPPTGAVTNRSLKGGLLVVLY